MLDEMERALHDALCIVKRTLESSTVSPCIQKLLLNAVVVYFDEIIQITGYVGGITILCTLQGSLFSYTSDYV